MEENNNSIFRKKSLERISTPEELDKYLTVTGPGVWFPLLAVVVLLIGVFAWAVLGHLDTKLNVAVVSGDGGVICCVPADKLDNALQGGTVRIADGEYALRDDGLAAQLITAETDINMRLAGSLTEDDIIRPLAVDVSLPEGVYEGEIIVETVNPISFIIN